MVTNRTESLRRALFGTLLAAAVATSARAATIVVNTTSEAIDPADGYCSLREAILSANHDDDAGTNCIAGSGDDTIVLPSLTVTMQSGKSSNRRTRPRGR